MLSDNKKTDCISSLSPGQQILNIDEVVKMTGLSKSYIYVLTHSKRIPYYKPNGGRIYFEKTEITAWLLTNRISPIDEIKREADKYCLNHK